MEMHPRFDQYDAIFGDDPGSYLEFLDALEATLTKSKANLLMAAAASRLERHFCHPPLVEADHDPLGC